MALGPAQVHAEQHVGPVLGLRSSRTRVKGDDGVALVVFASEERADLEVLDARAEPGEPRFDLGLDAGIAFGLSELVQDGQVFVHTDQVVVRLQVVLEAGQLPELRLRGCLIVPEVGCGRFLLELRYRRTLRVDVKDRPWHRRAPSPRPRAPKSDQPPWWSL